jgi:2-(1,2-epoxy-1,2-dihydrophenyl)acetyl-CoA isomerase
MPGPVLLDVEGGVARLRLNRPEASNALNRELLEALATAVRSLQRDGTVRAVVLSGEGENFCAGGDVREFASKGDALPDHLREMTALLGFIANGLVHLDAPVVSVVQGAATGGGGLGLVCATDFVLAGPRARFMLGATRVGMAPDAGISITLTRLVGLRQALRIALTNAMLDAHEARSIGLVTEVVAEEALYETALALARDLAANASLAQAQTKRLIWRGLSTSFEEALPDEARTVAELSGTADAREGLAALLERRDPAFHGREGSGGRRVG